MYKFSKRSLERMEGIDEKLVIIAHRALSISKIDFGIPEFGGLRNSDQQKKLFDLGKSKVDGTEVKSKHQYGKALDVFAYVDGNASWDIEYMAQIAAAFLQASNSLGYNIIWGGLWENFIDTPHFELVGKWQN